MKKLTLICLLFLVIRQSASAQTIAKALPVNLTCELYTNPLGIDVAKPGFGYVLKAADDRQRDIRQTAYQILVSADANFSKVGVYWDSKKVRSNRMAYLTYQGEALKSSQKYWWKVRVWDQFGHVSAWSKAANFTMGILNPNEWKAKWISAAGAEKYALSPVGYKSADDASFNGIKWVQVDLGLSTPFSEILLYPMFFNDRAGWGFPLRFKVDVADEPSFKTSLTIADYTNADFANPYFKPAHIAAKNAKGRYVRVTVTKSAKTGGGYAFALRQVAVLASGKNIASGKTVTATDNDDSNGFSKKNLTDQVEDYATFPNYSSLLLRKEFMVKPKLVRAVIHVSGLSEYELTLNGHKIGDYLLTPGWTDYRKTVLYDTYDVTAEIKNGNNAMGILLGNSVYNIQPDTLRYVKFLTSFGLAKTTAQLRLEYADGSISTVNTDKSWQASTGPITYANLYGGEDYDANLSPAGWDKPDFKANGSWQAALETDGPGGKLKGITSAAPPIKAIDTIKTAKINRINNHLLIYDFGQNASMMPNLQISGPKGSSIRMVPAELLGEDGLVDRRSATQDGARPAWWQYTLNGNGSENWSPKFFYQGARYLQVELSPATTGGELPKIQELADVIAHSSATPVGRFKSSNPLFNQIYSLVRWAQRSNMMSLMTDCPHREKMGWLEENHLNGPSLRYNFDMAPLFRKTMNDMADAQLENGLVPNIAPEYFIAGPPDMSNGFRNSPEWGSSFIIVPWQQYQFSGDISLLARYYDQMKKYVGFLSKEAKNNIISTGLGDWYDIGPKEPWGSQLTPVSFTATVIYYYDNWIMQRIAQTLGKTADATAFKLASENIRTSFNNTFYKPETGLYATGSQTCSAMPLFFNLVEPQNRQKLLDALAGDIRKRNNSFTSGEVGYRFLLMALANNGRSDVIYDMNNQSDKPGYGYQIKKGATSLTEKWDAGVGNFGSQNHFMSGQINEWFFNSLVGISPREDDAGFRKFDIKPEVLKDLDWVEGSFASISGDIVCSWKKSFHQTAFDITVPANTEATFYAPGVNAKQVFEGGIAANKAKGIKFMGEENGKLKYQLASGSYHFSVED